jgi:hypothetical protein
MSKRFKPSKKRFAQYLPGFGLLHSSEKEKLQNDMSEISNQIEQLLKDNYFLDQAIKTITSIIELTGATIALSKLKSWLTSTNLYIKKLEQFKKVIDKNKTLSKLASPSMLKNTGTLKTEIPKLSIAMKALNVGFIVISLNEIKKNLDEIKTLKSSKINKDDFESNEDRIKNLISKNNFEIIRLVNSVASFIPGAFAITTAIDAVLLVFNPDNVENLGYTLDGFSGGKDEAKTVWENAKKASNSFYVQDVVSFYKAYQAALSQITDQNIKKMLEKTLRNLYLSIDGGNEFTVKSKPNARFDVFNKFNNVVKNIHSQEEYRKFILWSDKPGNAAIISELILIFKAFYNNERRAKLQQIVEKMEQIKQKVESTKDINLWKNYAREIKLLNKQYDEILGK